MNASANAWKMDRDAEGIVWLTLDKPGTSTNVLGRAILEELGTLIGPLAANPPKGLVIKSGKASGFIAGADIKEFTGFKSATEAYALIRNGQLVFDQIEALPCPTVAAIHGFALGGGLGARARLSLSDCRG